MEDPVGRVTEADLDEAAVYIIQQLNRVLFVEDVKKALGYLGGHRLRAAVNIAGQTYQIPRLERERIYRSLKENPRT